MSKRCVDKQELLSQLLSHLQQDIDATLRAVNEAHALASHEQSKPENQYDTLALEAAYLAHGQSERIAELQRQMMLLNQFDFSAGNEGSNDDSRITVGALVCIEGTEESAKESADSSKSQQQWLWLLPVSGGVLLESEIRTITPEAPLAKKLMGIYVGDEFVLNLGHKKKQFEVIELL
ncbi:MAG: hypothetical protein JKY50_06910 [Oleispira sp.]|nr:hypothetical protein [Oleispira sp.]MBL4881971.1 hypothetical protein [Oleispira sp.]